MKTPVLDMIEQAARAAARVLEPAKRAGMGLQDDFDRNQHALHGLSWLATTVETLRALAHYAKVLEQTGKLGETEQLLIAIAGGEYLNQIAGGIPMNQTEMFRLSALGLGASDLAPVFGAELYGQGNTAANRARLVVLMQEGEGQLTTGSCGLDASLDDMRVSMQRFCAAKVTPFAHQWHRQNDYVPLDVIQELADLGVFALTLPEQHGGLALSKEAMCVVSEELSRGWIAVGSLGTRAEIACELILCGGTEEQKANWLPKIASGEILPTAVFTEPDTGSDLGALKTRAVGMAISTR